MFKFNNYLGLGDLLIFMPYPLMLAGSIINFIELKSNIFFLNNSVEPVNFCNLIENINLNLILPKKLSFIVFLVEPDYIKFNYARLYLKHSFWNYWDWKSGSFCVSNNTIINSYSPVMSKFNYLVLRNYSIVDDFFWSENLNILSNMETPKKYKNYNILPKNEFYINPLHNINKYHMLTEQYDSVNRSFKEKQTNLKIITTGLIFSGFLKILILNSNI